MNSLHQNIFIGSLHTIMMEMMDVVDEQDIPIGHASRKEMYSKGLRHRIVHVLIFDDKGRMAIQLRSEKVSFCPHHWSTAVGGHVKSGETYEAAAARECLEEIGVKLSLQFFSKDEYSAADSPPKFLVTYKAVFNGPFKPNPDEVDKVEFFSIGRLKKMAESGEKFHQELLFLLKKHFFSQD